MYKRILFPCFFICFGFLLLGSCDSDFNELGADMIGGDNFEVGEPETFSVAAYNPQTGPVETSDLAINALGIYNDPVFGKTTASFALQLRLPDTKPVIDPLYQPEIDSVVVSIPYFATRETLETSGLATYTLDSIYGDPEISKMKLSVYESKFFMQNVDPNSPTGETKKYYSNQKNDFDAVKGQKLNTFPDLAQNDEFFFDKKQVINITTDEEGVETPSYKSPRLRLKLDKNFFKTKIMEAPAGKLSDDSAFQEYFRGLYFTVEEAPGYQSCMAMLNLKGNSTETSNLTIYYTELKDKTLPDGERVKKTIVMSLSGRSVNFLENQPVNPIPESGMIYLKGGQGSMAIIDLFGRDANGNSAELDNLRTKKWLVNDASLTFKVNSGAMSSSVNEPNRIYLYDLTNKRPIADYYSDQTTAVKPKYAKTTFGGIIKKQNGRGYEYKIRLTNYIRALLKNEDSTNVRLGLVVTESIAEINNKKLKTEIPTFGIKYIPTASVLSPLGTVIYGTDAVIPEDDRIKFKIYFTKPKQN
ncbi:DUF4270 domain-containing protein [Flavobacterium sp. CYK-55]|uniref:DUF4270 domain-containing protein n=1 Tax=Flavobacterium sp. CYK-55 TaxID=2835529 RepID=UPI001BCB644F|nr:DUF4270 domain-containing protein [Flavobacterium sp. CYK-55]MBS7787797.1 DUF4270 domain-containing protein [Flavobacterium sp. CYK-55]